jgi:hypothetical protein
MEKELEEIILLNLKMNSLILTALCSMDNCALPKEHVLKLLQDAKKILNKNDKDVK